MSKKEKVDITALTMCAPNTDKSIVWFTYNDRQYTAAPMLYDLFDVPTKYGNQMVYRNSEIFDGMVVEFEKKLLSDLGCNMQHLLTTGKGKSNTITCFTISGAIQWMGLLEYKRYKDERRAQLIALRNWVVNTAETAMLNVSPPDYRNTLEWKEQRDKCRQTNKMLNAILKDKIVPLHATENGRWIYINEAIMINKLVFGRHERGIRDTVPLDRLFVLESSEVADHTLCHVGIVDFKERERLLTELKDLFELYNPEERIKKLRGGQTSLTSYF